MLICVPVTGITGLGLGYIAYGLSELVKGTGDLSGLLVLAAVVIVLVLAWRTFGIRQRLQAYAAASADISGGALLASAPSLGADQEPPRPKPGASSGRRAA
jgi:hypothetical protein